jgi:general secretion pathway protein M
MNKPRNAAQSSLAQALAPLRTHWQSLGARERQALQLAALALGLLLLWTVLLAPALRVLREAPQQLAQLDAQLQQMQAQALEAQELRQQAPVAPAQARQALESASAHLGEAARLSITGDRAVLTLKELDAASLQTWLGEVRSAARARPVEASLQRGPKGYSGTIVLALGTGAP